VKSRISSKGQVTVPAKVRDLLGLEPGTAVEFLVREGDVVMRKGRAGNDPVDLVYGKLRLARPVDVLLEEMRGPRFESKPAKKSNRSIKVRKKR
jgi:AbrB family looped-hinge helix DNA binding protein